MLKVLPKSLYMQVIIGVIVGAMVGHFWPNVGSDMKPLGDAFIRAIRLYPSFSSENFLTFTIMNTFQCY